MHVCYLAFILNVIYLAVPINCNHRNCQVIFLSSVLTIQTHVGYIPVIIR